MKRNVLSLQSFLHDQCGADVLEYSLLSVSLAGAVFATLHVFGIGLFRAH